MITEYKREIFQPYRDRCVLASLESKQSIRGSSIFIDPGLSTTGISIWSRKPFIPFQAFHITTDNKQTDEERAFQSARELKQILTDYCNSGFEAYIEKPTIFFTQRAQTAMYSGSTKKLHYSYATYVYVLKLANYKVYGVEVNQHMGSLPEKVYGDRIRRDLLLGNSRIGQHALDTLGMGLFVKRNPNVCKLL